MHRNTDITITLADVTTARKKDSRTADAPHKNWDEDFLDVLVDVNSIVNVLGDATAGFPDMVVMEQIGKGSCGDQPPFKDIKRQAWAKVRRGLFTRNCDLMVDASGFHQKVWAKIDIMQTVAQGFQMWVFQNSLEEHCPEAWATVSRMNPPVARWPANDREVRRRQLQSFMYCVEVVVPENLAPLPLAPLSARIQTTPLSPLAVRLYLTPGCEKYWKAEYGAILLDCKGAPVPGRFERDQFPGFPPALFSLNAGASQPLFGPFPAPSPSTASTIAGSTAGLSSRYSDAGFDMSWVQVAPVSEVVPAGSWCNVSSVGNLSDAGSDVSLTPFAMAATVCSWSCSACTYDHSPEQACFLACVICGTQRAPATR